MFLKEKLTPELFNITNLTFKQLQEAYELAQKVVKITENGLVTIDGDEVVVEERNGGYYIAYLGNLRGGIH